MRTLKLATVLSVAGAMALVSAAPVRAAPITPLSAAAKPNTQNGVATIPVRWGGGWGRWGGGWGRGWGGGWGLGLGALAAGALIGSAIASPFTYGGYYPSYGYGYPGYDVGYGYGYGSPYGYSPSYSYAYAAPIRHFHRWHRWHRFGFVHRPFHSFAMYRYHRPFHSFAMYGYHRPFHSVGFVHHPWRHSFGMYGGRFHRTWNGSARFVHPGFHAPHPWAARTIGMGRGPNNAGGLVGGSSNGTRAY